MFIEDKIKLKEVGLENFVKLFFPEYLVNLGINKGYIPACLVNFDSKKLNNLDFIRNDGGYTLSYNSSDKCYILLNDDEFDFLPKEELITNWKKL